MLGWPEPSATLAHNEARKAIISTGTSSESCHMSRRGASRTGMAQVGNAENRLIGKLDSRLFSGTFLLVTHALETAG